MGFFTALIVVLVVIFIVIIAKGITIVQQAETVVIERLGRYHRTLQSGFNIIIPIIDKPREFEWRMTKESPTGGVFYVGRRMSRIDLRETVYDFPRQNVITRDNVMIEINALLYFQVTDPIKAVYEVGNLPDAIEKLTQTTLRNVIGEMDLDETLSSRDKVNSTLRTILDEATDKWGVKVNRVELQDINPPADIRDAMEKQMRAERDRRAAILEAEGLKRARILESEGVMEAQINRAEGEKKSQILAAEAEAETRVKVAQAEAEAISKITNAISGSNTRSDPANYLVAMRYIDTLKEMVAGKDSKTIYMPYEATGILSSVGGIKEMLDGIKHSG